VVPDRHSFRFYPTVRFAPGSAEHTAAVAAIKRTVSLADAPVALPLDKSYFNKEPDRYVYRCNCNFGKEPGAFIYSFVSAEELALLDRSKVVKRTSVGHWFVVPRRERQMIELWNPSTHSEGRLYALPAAAAAEVRAAFQPVLDHVPNVAGSTPAERRAKQEASAVESAPASAGGDARS